MAQEAEMLLAVAEGAVVKAKMKGPRRGEDFELNQALVKADFWLLFFSFFCGVGTGVTAINNLGQIGAAQGYSDVTMFVTLFGVFNFLGRLGGGSVSEHYIRYTNLSLYISLFIYIYIYIDRYNVCMYIYIYI
jgi:predicted MFS family arabinose efflux permease